MAKDWGITMDNIIAMLKEEGFTFNEKIALLEMLMDRLQDESDDD